MKKDVFKQKAMEILELQYQRMKEDAERVIDQMDERKLEEYESNFFAPKAFWHALVNMHSEHVCQRSYTNGFVRRWNKAVRRFENEIVYGR